MFGFRKHIRPSKWVCSYCLLQGEGDPEEHRCVAVSGRAQRNPTQQLIVASEGSQRTATQLVGDAGSNVPALTHAMTQIATRFEQFVGNVHALNVGLQEFKRDIVEPFREELKHLRYTTGDRLNHASADLETYVSKLDKVLWAALRAQGMSDESIRRFRTQEGMEPEALRGRELELHLQEFEGLKRQNGELVAQNRRLLARLGGHTHWSVGGEWEYLPTCACQVCTHHKQDLQAASEEASQ